MNRSSLLLLPVAVLLAGCLSPGPSPTVRYFQLTERSPAPAAIGSLDTPIQIGPIDIPPYLRRPQLATRQGGQEILYQEFERWAEPLDLNLADTLTRDLTVLLNSEQIVAYSPRLSHHHIPRQLMLRIHRFDVNDRGQAELLATYTVVTSLKEATLIQRFQATLPVSDPSPAARVSALNTLVHQLADALATDLAKSP